MTPINEKIKRIRQFKNYTQQYMAERLGITQGGYNNLESGKVDIPISRIEEIAKILEVSVIEILTYNSTPLENTHFEFDDSVKSNEEIKKLYEHIIQQYKDYILALKDNINELKEKANYYKTLYDSSFSKRVGIPNLDKPKKQKKSDL